MTTPFREIDEDVARAEYAPFLAKCQVIRSEGQRLLARIRQTSKYFGQGDEGALFPVAVASSDEYCVVGGPGGKYRLRDVDLFAVFSDDSAPTQITFEK
jgi:hypothetical protein